MVEITAARASDTWNILVCGLPLAEDAFDLGEGLSIRRLRQSLTIFDLAAAGGVGFREWATLEPFASKAKAEISSPIDTVQLPGYDPLNRCWLVSSLLVIRGFAGHICPACSSYSWNFIAGHQKSSSGSFRKQLSEEGVMEAVFNPRSSLPPFNGGLLDYHLKVLLPSQTTTTPFDSFEADWIRANFAKFNQLAGKDERFRFALEAAIDWRYAKDPRAAVARLWAGIESLLGINSELVYRVSLASSTVLAARGSERIDAYKKAKNTYGIRSKAVHGEPITNGQLQAGLYDSFEILRSLLLDAVERGATRTENDFIDALLG